jgi:hypothetical protein
LNQNPHPPLLFCNSPIPESLTATIVGLTLSATLSWGPHIKRIARYAKRALALLYRARPFITRPALATLYKSHVRSRMEYLGPIWQGGSDDQLKALDVIQNKAVRIIGPGHCHNIKDLAHRRDVSGLCFMHRLIYGTAPSGVLDLTPPRAAPTRTTRQTPDFLQDPGTCRNNYWPLSCVPYYTRQFNRALRQHPHVQNQSSLQPFKKSVNNISLFLNKNWQNYVP